VILVLVSLFPALEEGLQTFEGDVLPAGDESGLQLVMPRGLGPALQTREDFEDDLGLELRSERPVLAFRHGRMLRGGRY
jgi:hypothetical protein